MKDCIAIFALSWLIILTTILTIGVLGLAAQVISYNIDNVPVTLYVRNTAVWHGRSACINLKTQGGFTIATIHDGNICLNRSAFYSTQSSDIRLEGQK